jgi:hypothetical protein
MLCLHENVQVYVHCMHYQGKVVSDCWKIYEHYVTEVPEPSALEVELAIEKLKSHKSPGIDQIPAELIKAWDTTIRCAILKLIIAIWNKEELPEEW